MAAKKELKEIKRAIRYIKIARRLGHVGFHALLGSKNFDSEVTKTLENFCNWSEEDEKETDKIAEEFKKETEGKTLEEQGKKLKKILTIGGGIATGLGAIGMAAYFLKKKGKNTV